MLVSIEFFGIQRMITKTDSIKMPITGNTAVSDVLKYVRNKYPDLLLDEEILLTAVNHEAVSPDRLLRSNDTICFIPGIGGG